jgi:hypothetical protein
MQQHERAKDASIRLIDSTLNKAAGKRSILESSNSMGKDLQGTFLGVLAKSA